MSAKTRWIHNFSDPLPLGGAELKALVGGKGASLKEMTLAGLHVPPGFTLTTACCEAYFQQDRRWPDGLERELRENLHRLEQETGRTFGRGARPLLVSVRSGAALSMPGMMDTLLNCGLHPGLANDVGDTPWLWEAHVQFIRMFAKTVHELKEEAFATAQRNGHMDRAVCESHLQVYEQHTGRPFPTDPWELLVQCVNAVFESWLSERAVAYRQKHGIRHLRGTAVNVQAMFPSEISGILFTQDPTDHRANRIVIESSYGLGEAVVSGDVTPDRFVVCREDRTKVESTIGQKVSMVSAFGQRRQLDPHAPSLTTEQICELVDLAFRIENHFGYPVDIEWGWADGKFALLQSRPIRGLDVAREVEPARVEEIERLKALAKDHRRVWVVHNLGETLRFPTPLTWDIMRRFMSGSGGFGRLYRQLGYRPSRRVCEEGFLELIAGRIYADPDRLAELFWEGMPLRYDLDAIVADKSLLDRAPNKFDAAKADGLFLARLPANLLSMWRTGRNMKRARIDAKHHFDQQVLPKFLQYVEAERSRDLSGLSDAQVLSLLRERCTRVLDDFGPESLAPGFYGGLAFSDLESILTQLMGPSDGPELARTLTLALDGDVTFEQDALLHGVACGKATLEQFLARFGHRCIGEMELSIPRWREDPTYLHQTVGRLRSAKGRTPPEIHHQGEQRRQEAERQLPGLLEQWGGSSLRERIDGDLADARALLPYRESGKFYLMRGYELIRMAIQELARRWELHDDIYFLRIEELDRFAQERQTLTDTIARRKLRWKAFQRLDLPDVIDSMNLDGLGIAPPPAAASEELAATPMAPGIATGTVRIVEDPQQAGDLGLDYVLVCASTDPGWTPLFMSARALVVERGGVLSHGAIVARDFGIPAVACPNATRLLRDGQAVRIDGNRGLIQTIGNGKGAGHA